MKTCYKNLQDSFWRQTS